MDAPAGRFDWANQTILHPLGLAAIVVLGLALMTVPRRWTMLPLILMTCFISPAQRIVLFSLNFTLLRVMVVCGWLRLGATGEFKPFTWKSMDWLVLAWALSGTVVYTVQTGGLDGLKYKLGTSFDAVGMYFLFRCLVRDGRDLDRTIRYLIWTGVIVLGALAVEGMTGKNLFALFGYVPETTILREGRFRCQGAFAHPILAGCFWASLMPLMAARWWTGVGRRGEALIGWIASAGIVLLTASTTPIVAVLLGLAGAAFFPLRSRMRWVVGGVLLLLVELHLVMRAPVWHLISRTDLAGGSTGWHRYYLINEALRRVGDWWLWGTPSTADWGPGLYDLTNQYVLEGVRGGLITLIFFLLLIGSAFRSVGRLVRSVAADREQAVLAWALGVSLFVHVMNFVAVSYFGQIWLIWYLLLAAIASLTPVQRTRAPVRTVPAGFLPAVERKYAVS